MVAIKSQISSIFGTNQMRATEFVKKEIQNIVESAQIPGTLLDQDDDELQATDAELLISKLIDGELANSELQMVEKLVTENDTYRELYEQLVTAKINISDNLFQENTGPSAKVKMNIKSLVEHELGKSDDGGEQIEEAPRMLAGLFHRTSRMEPSSKPSYEPSYEPTEPAQNVINLKKRSVVSSLNYYAQRLVPLAAVFVVGLYISPTLFSSGPIGPYEYSENLRGGGIPVGPNGNFDFISIIQSKDVKTVNLMENGMMPRGEFYLRLTAPSAGEMSISFETSEQNDITKVKKGKTSENLGQVKTGQIVRYPTLKTKAMEVDGSDQLLRIDIEIRGDNKIFRFTKFIEFDSLKKLE